MNLTFVLLLLLRTRQSSVSLRYLCVYQIPEDFLIAMISTLCHTRRDSNFQQLVDVIVLHTVRLNLAQLDEEDVQKFSHYENIIQTHVHIYIKHIQFVFDD